MVTADIQQVGAPATVQDIIISSISIGVNMTCSLHNGEEVQFDLNDRIEAERAIQDYAPEAQVQIALSDDREARLQVAFPHGIQGHGTGNVPLQCSAVDHGTPLQVESRIISTVRDVGTPWGYRVLLSPSYSIPAAFRGNVGAASISLSSDSNAADVEAAFAAVGINATAESRAWGTRTHVHRVHLSPARGGLYEAYIHSEMATDGRTLRLSSVDMAQI